jgi:hypothetical protein
MSLAPWTVPLVDSKATGGLCVSTEDSPAATRSSQGAYCTSRRTGTARR